MSRHLQRHPQRLLSRRRRSVLSGLLAPLGAMLLLALLSGLLLSYQMVTASERVGLADATEVGGRSAGAALPGTGMAEVSGLRPMPSAGGVPPQQPPGSSSAGDPPGVGAPSRLFKFLLTQPDGLSPIRWNPCAPVRFKVELSDPVPQSEIAGVRAAFDRAGRAMGGVQFVYQGLTSVVPATVDDSKRADTDIVFAFARSGKGPQTSALLTGWEAGRAGFAAWGVPDNRGAPLVQLPTHGSVLIDVDKWRVMDRHDRTLLYLHEIGHVVGLDHPDDPNQVMSSGAYDLPADYQAGDVAALARLGRQAGCLS